MNISFDTTAVTSDTSSEHPGKDPGSRMQRHPEYGDTTCSGPIPDNLYQQNNRRRRPIGQHGSCLLLNDRKEGDEATGEYDYWGKFPKYRLPIEIFQYFYPEEVLEQ